MTAIDIQTKAKFLCNLCDCVSIGNKGEQNTKKIFEKYAYANCYSDRIATNKSIPGTLQIKGDGKKNRYIVNMFIQFYPGQPKYPNDNIIKRCEWFNACIEKLLEIPNAESFAFPNDIGIYETADYSDRFINLLDDFRKKYYLKNRQIITIVDYSDDNILIKTEKIQITYADPINNLRMTDIDQFDPEIRPKIDVVRHIELSQLIYVGTQNTVSPEMIQSNIKISMEEEKDTCINGKENEQILTKTGKITPILTIGGEGESILTKKGKIASILANEEENEPIINKKEQITSILADDAATQNKKNTITKKIIKIGKKVRKFGNKPVDTHENTHEDKPVDTHENTHEDKPVDTHENTHEDKPVDTHEDKPVDTHEDKPVDTHEDKPVDTHENTHEDKPVDTHEDKPVDTDEDKPKKEKRLYDKNLHWTKNISELVEDLDPSWDSIFKNPIIIELLAQLDRDFAKEMEGFGDFIEILPIPQENIFYAFKKCPFNKIKVLLNGQDCYAEHLDQAMGLSFSVPQGVKIPPSLENIFKELSTDIKGFISPTSGDLTKWAEQGVLLLNSALTVRYKQKTSHMKLWKTFTDTIIQLISEKSDTPIVFMLWGLFSKGKKPLIANKSKHFILEASHPSPLSANKGGWFGNKHFSQCNTFLIRSKITPIDWNL